MKTFFHPDAPSTAIPLAKVALGHLLQSASTLQDYVVHHTSNAVAFGSLGIAGLSLLLFSGADTEMPGLVTGKGKDLPAEVEQAAREVFDGRFAKHGDSYYTLVVHYVPNHSSELSGVNQMLGGSAENTVKSPLVAWIDLVEIRDLRTEVEPAELKRHDELNHITWKGKLQVKGGVERRRTLDLTAWLKDVSKAKGAATIPWMEKPVALEDARKPKGNADAPGDIMEMMGGLFTMFTPDLKNELGNALKGGNWRDWQDCGTASYQVSEFTLRDGKANHTTLEAMDAALGGTSEVSLIALHSSNYLHLAAMEEVDNTVFLTKPNIKALRDAGIIK